MKLKFTFNKKTNFVGIISNNINLIEIKNLLNLLTNKEITLLIQNNNNSIIKVVNEYDLTDYILHNTASILILDGNVSNLINNKMVLNDIDLTNLLKSKSIRFAISIIIFENEVHGLINNTKYNDLLKNLNKL